MDNVWYVYFSHVTRKEYDVTQGESGLESDVIEWVVRKKCLSFTLNFINIKRESHTLDRGKKPSSDSTWQHDAGWAHNAGSPW
jgi:hypothetical protein